MLVSLLYITLLTELDTPSIPTLSPSSSSRPPVKSKKSSEPNVNNEILSKLMDFGFEKAICVDALQQNNNDLERTLDFLLAVRSCVVFLILVATSCFQ